MTTKFTLPISPSYVAHWGLWEAVRELYQNALDVRDAQVKAGAVGYAEMDFEVREAEGGETTLYVTNTGEQLKPQSLILGNTTKADDPDQRGKFGEGYKLALLVLCRLGFRVDIVNGTEWWTPKIEYDEQFGSDVLNIYVGPSGMDTGTVQFRVHGIQPEQWQDIQKNIHPCRNLNMVLSDPDQCGRIYVGGLYVCTMPEFKRGYAFKPGTLPLDRDRGMVNGFDLSLVTSRIWADHDEDDAAVELLEQKAPDVEYVTSHVRNSSPIVTRSVAVFAAKHGDAVPVSTQAEVERATRAGVRWVLVTDTVKAIIGKVRSWFIPSTKSPVERLQDFVTQHQYRLSSDMKAELLDIIKSMSPQEEPCESTK